MFQKFKAKFLDERAKVEGRGAKSGIRGVEP